MTTKKLEKYNGKMPFIDPKMPYNIGLAAFVAMVCRTTLRKDAMLGVIPYSINEKNGRLCFKGKDLIKYRENYV